MILTFRETDGVTGDRLTIGESAVPDGSYLKRDGRYITGDAGISGDVQHNLTTGKQGGAAGEYYHLTAAEYGGNWGATGFTMGTLGCGTITVADGSGINLQENITFTGATTENKVLFPDNLAVAWSIGEGANIYQSFDSTDGSEAIRFNVKVGIGAIAPAPLYLLHVLAADGVADNTYVAYFSNAETTVNRNNGVWINAGSSASDYNIRCASLAGAPLWSVTGAGLFTINNTLNLGNGAVGAPAWAFIADPDTGAYYTATQINYAVAGGLSTYMNANGLWSNRISIGTLPPEDSAHMLVYDNNYNRTTTSTGLFVHLRKTLGASTHACDLHAGYFFAGMDDADAAVGHLRGLVGIVSLNAGEVGQTGNPHDMNGLRFSAQVAGGTVWGDIYGTYSELAIGAGGEIKGDVFGVYSTINTTGTVGGTSYGYYLKEAGSPDYGYFQNGTAPNSFGGDLQFHGDGSGLLFGSCYGNHIAWTQALAVDDEWYNISDADFVSGQLNNVTHDGSGELTVAVAGRYLIQYSLCYENNVANDHVEGGIEISNSGAAEADGQCHLENKFANEEEHMGSSAILDLAANATIEICIRTTDANTPNFTVHAVNISVTAIGGT